MRGREAQRHKTFLTKPINEASRPRGFYRFFNLIIMKNYDEFLKTKEKTFISSGFKIDESDLNPMLFPFQKYAVKVALEKGRFALFEDCGLGKTAQQLEWAKQVFNHTVVNCFQRFVILQSYVTTSFLLLVIKTLKRNLELKKRLSKHGKTLFLIVLSF